MTPSRKDTSEPVKSLTREQVRAVDAFAIERLGVPGVVLMENAGRNAARHVLLFSRRLEESKIAVVAGGGNNGGDGFVVARHLSNAGIETAVFIVAPPEKISGDALVNLRIIQNLGLDIHFYHEPEKIDTLSKGISGFGIFVDAIGGTGIRPPLRGVAAKAVEQINELVRPVVAVDIPTGLDCDTGRPGGGPVVMADITVTFVARKVGFDNPRSKKFTGHVVVADIGLPLIEDFLEKD